MAQALATEVLILAGTNDGLFLLRSDRGRAEWRISGPFLPGHDVTHAVRDSRDGELWAAANPRDGAPSIFHSADEGESWTRCGDLPACERAWHVRPGRRGENGRVWAGVMPATLLRSDDDGETWIPANEGTRSMAEMVAAEMPGGKVEHPGVHRCVHKVALDPNNPETLYMQQHEGVFRSDDGGRTWRDIGSALPSPFGFPVAAAPGEGPAGCSVWVIPENDETIRTTAEGLRVWRTDNGGESWTPSVNGLPTGEHNVLREGMAADTLNPAGVYFGTTAGTLYASADRGAHWRPIAEGLPRIQSVEVSLVG
jgi:photosystem II stability/assembly factor-like uncharacterized protein